MARPVARPIDLFEGEVALTAWECTQKKMRWPWQLGTGFLQLTTQRLIFMRPPFLLRTEEVVMLPLSEIESCVDARAALEWRGVVKIRMRSGQRVRFYPIRLAPDSREIAEEIRNAMRDSVREESRIHG